MNGARACELCKHVYVEPCDGKREDCPNRIHHEKEKRS